VAVGRVAIRELQRSESRQSTTAQYANRCLGCRTNHVDSQSNAPKAILASLPVLGSHDKLGGVSRAALHRKRPSPNTIRHTCATHLLRAGVDIKLILIRSARGLVMRP
jgi:hypothetical protein